MVRLEITGESAKDALYDLRGLAEALLTPGDPVAAASAATDIPATAPRGRKRQSAATPAPDTEAPAADTLVPAAPAVNTPAPAPAAPVAPSAAPAPATTPPAAQAAPAASTAPATPSAIPAPGPAPAERAVTLDDISNAGSALIDMGKMDAIMSLMGKYGVQAITQLKAETYPAFAADLRALGAPI